MVLYNGRVTSAVQVDSFVLKSSKSWTINHKQPCIWFNIKKTTFGLIKSVIKQQQEEAYATQCGDEILPEEDVHWFPAIYRISACIFALAPPALETQVSPSLIAVHTISPWIFFQFIVLQLVTESAHIHIAPAFSLFLPRPALPWLCWQLVGVGTLSLLQGMAPSCGTLVPHSTGWTSPAAASPPLLGTACTQAIRRIFFLKTQL